MKKIIATATTYILAALSGLCLVGGVAVLADRR